MYTTLQYRLRNISLLLCCVVLGMIINMRAHAQEKQAHIVEVTGYGTASAASDYATIAVGVAHTADSAAVAMERTSKSMNELFRVLDDLQIPKKHRKTQNISLYPSYEQVACMKNSHGWCEEGADRKRVYDASNAIRIHVGNLDILPTVLIKLTTVGANTIHSIQFGVASRDVLEAQAQEKAIIDATKRARRYAEAAGLALGSVISIIEQPIMNERSYYAAQNLQSDMATSVPIAEGESSVSTAVRVVFALQ